MSDVAALIADMVRAGVDPDLIGRTAATIAGAEKAEPKTLRQQRNARHYQRKVSEKRLNSDDQDVSDGEVSPKKETSPTPPKEKTTPSTVSEARASSTETRAGFDEFWSLFPNKVGKRDAEREFALALKRAAFTDIMAGLRRYVAKTDDRPWCNPSTFLHQDRWADQPAEMKSHRATAPPPKQTVGQQARDELKRMGLINAPDKSTGHFDQGDGSPGFASTGITRRIAIAAG